MASLAQVESQISALRVLCARYYEWLLANGKEPQSFFAKTYPRSPPGCPPKPPTADDFNRALRDLLATGYQPPGSWNAAGPSTIEDLTPDIEAAILELESLAKLLGTPAANATQSEGIGGVGSTPEQPTTDHNVKRKQVLKGLQPADRKAYLSFVYAESKVGKRLEDHEAHEWLTENGIDTDKGDLGELADYELPAFETWTRQIREARNALDEQKYTSRAGREGRSIVERNRVEYQGESEE
jgi:hypothetical protein